MLLLREEMERKRKMMIL
jgi:growth arrest-specific protein 8